MPDVLIIADTVRSPELRHEVPLAVPDPFLYAETGGKRFVVVSSLESGRVVELGTGLEVLTYEDVGMDELLKRGLDSYEFERELNLNAVRQLDLEAAVTPNGFPLGQADYLRSQGIELTADQPFFDERRRVKTEHELAGIRRACRAVEAGMGAGLALLKGPSARMESSRSPASRSPASGSSSKSSVRSASTGQPPRNSSSRTGPRLPSAMTAAPVRSRPTTSSSSTSFRAIASRRAIRISRAPTRSAPPPTSSGSTTGSRRRRSSWRSQPSSRA